MAPFQPTTGPERIGFTVGHWTDRAAKTGCTVVVFDRAAPAIVDVRGGAPGTRETDLLGPGRLVQSVDAIVLSGGSAFGLASADGVMSELRELGRGVATPAGPVPIVPAAVIYDLAVGLPIAPTPANGAQAFQNRGSVDALARGLVGAGVGATTSKLFDSGGGERGGFGVGVVELGGERRVVALAVVNAGGRVVVPATGESALPPNHVVDRAALLERLIALHERSATTLAVVTIDAPCDRQTLERSGVAAHDGLARAIWPCHTLFDGDVVFVAGMQAGAPSPAETMQISLAVELAVERAVVDAVTAT
jgi:L-aminopeptidase/D-esterase-like protein